MKTYVVMIICSFDDVVIGCYQTKGAARERAKQATLDPIIRFDYEDRVSVDTDPLLVRILCFKGKRLLGSEDLELRGKKKRR